MTRSPNQLTSLTSTRFTTIAVARLENRTVCVYLCFAVLPTRKALRRFRFVLLETLLLPVAMPLLRLMAMTWRVRAPAPAALEEMNREPRLILATFHGMLLQMLGFRWLPAAYGRRMVVMLSPSLDGRLLAAALAYVGVDHVYGTTGSRGIAGSLEFIRRVKAGDVGMIAVDGPRGPCCVAKRGFLQIAAAADAHVILATTAGRPGISFGSWDRAHLPIPFAHVQLSLRMIAPPISGEDEQVLAAAQTSLLEAARALHSPVLPPALRQPPAV